MQEKEKHKTKKQNQTELTQWHPAFCSATKLELVKNKNKYGRSKIELLADRGGLSLGGFCIDNFRWGKNKF